MLNVFSQWVSVGRREDRRFWYLLFPLPGQWTEVIRHSLNFVIMHCGLCLKLNTVL